MKSNTGDGLMTQGYGANGTIDTKHQENQRTDI